MYSSPVVLVDKPNGEKRLVLDFRMLDSVTRKDVHPLPRIDTILDILQGCRYISSIDLSSAFWQVPLDESSKPKTAFVTTSGLYEFNVRPMGLVNASAVFSRLIAQVLRPLQGKCCFSYIDDIIC